MSPRWCENASGSKRGRTHTHARTHAHTHTHTHTCPHRTLKSHHSGLYACTGRARPRVQNERRLFEGPELPQVCLRACFPSVVDVVHARKAPCGPSSGCGYVMWVTACVWMNAAWYMYICVCRALLPLGAHCASAARCGCPLAANALRVVAGLRWFQLRSFPQARGWYALVCACP